MSSNLQATFKNLKTSVYNIRLVANSVLSIANNHCPIQVGTSKNLHFLGKQNYPLAERLPLPNYVHPVEMRKSSPHRTRDIKTGAIFKHQTQVGLPNTIDSLQKKDSQVRKYEKSFVNDSKGIMQGMHNSRNENIFSMNNGALTKACVAFWHASQSNVRSYSTGSSEKKEDVKSNVSSSSGSVSENENKEVPLSRKEMLKKAMKDYGSTVVIFYVGISLISLGSFYLLVSSGLDVVAILQRLGWGDSALSNKLAAGASTFVVAYAIHMVFASVRISITLAVTPFIVRYLRNKGFLQKPPGTKGTF